MKKYSIGLAIIVAAGILMGLPYVLRRDKAPSSPATQEEGVPPEAEPMTPKESAPPASPISPPPTPAETEAGKPLAPLAKVDILDFKFVPPSIKIKKGTTVQWTNRDSIVHTVSADSVGPDSEFLGKDKNYSHTFSEPGVFSYHCKPHPFMQGRVEVTD